MKRFKKSIFSLQHENCLQSILSGVFFELREKKLLGKFFLLSEKLQVLGRYYLYLAYLGTLVSCSVYIYIFFSLNTTTDIHGACVYVCMYKVAVLIIRIE